MSGTSQDTGSDRARDALIAVFEHQGFSRAASEELYQKAIERASSSIAAQRKLERARSRQYQEWLQECSPELIWTKPVHKLVCDHIDALTNGDITHLAIFMPPRLGKSQAVTIRFPVYWLERNPSNRVIIGAYNKDLATFFASESKRIYERRNPEPLDKEAADEWINGSGGGVLAVGVGSGVTGRGADCLVGGTRIKTSIGDICIQDLVRLQYRPDVLAYDHASGALVYRKIVAAREVAAREVIEIVTEKGRTIRATRDHRFWAVESGYQKAELLRPGDRLLVAKECVPAVRGKQAPREQDVFRLLQDDAAPHGDAEVRVVRQGVRAQRLRVREVATARACGHLLFEDVLGEPSCRQKQAQVRGVWRSGRQTNRGAILLPEVQGRPSRARAPEAQGDMPLVWGSVCGSKQSEAILQQGVRELSALGPHVRRGELPLQRWLELRQAVCGDAPDSSRSRQAPLRRLRGSGRNLERRVVRADCREDESSHASHQRGPKGQSPGKPDYSLSEVSCSASQVEEDTVSVVRVVRGECVPVYDIQVEDCRNFFAEEVLVHNCIIVDDPVKGAEEANSVAYQQRVWQWWLRDMYTRRNSPGKTPVILINTRWHDMDLAGRILDSDRDHRWTVLSLPALAEENDLLGRAVGESIWPERLPVEELLIARETMQGGFEAMYQQNPAPAEGALIKEAWFWFSEIDPEMVVTRCRFWDLAASEVTRANDRPDWTAGVKMCAMKRPDSTYRYAVEDVRRERALTGDRDDMIVETAIADGLDCAQVFEEGDDGDKAVTSALRKRLPGYAVIGRKPRRDKIVRSTNFRSALQRGEVFLVRGRWNTEYISELVRFPVGRHDDQVDGSSGAFDELVVNSLQVTIRG